MNKENNITAVHIIAAIMVIVGHEFTLIGVQSPCLLGLDINGLGVRILFVVSGYLIAYSYERSKNALAFFLKRIKRLYPPLMLCLLVTILCMSFISTSRIDYWSSARDYFLNNLIMRPRYFLAGVFEKNPVNQGVNGSLWTLPIEIACYIAIIPICGFVKKIKKTKTILSKSIVAFLLGLIIIFNLYRMLRMDPSAFAWRDVDWYSGFELFEYFYIGYVINVVDFEYLLNGQVAALLIIVLICSPESIATIIKPLIISYGVMAFALTPNPIFSHLFKNDICYELYLYGFPIQQTVISMVNNSSMSVYTYLMLTLPGVIIVAYFAYLFNKNIAVTIK